MADKLRHVAMAVILVAASMLAGCVDEGENGSLGSGENGEGEQDPGTNNNSGEGVALSDLEECDFTYAHGGDASIPCENQVNELSVEEGRPGPPDALCVYNSGFNSLARPLYLMYWDPVGERISVYWDLELEEGAPAVHGLFYMETEDGVLVTQSWFDAGTEGHVWFPFPGEGIFFMKIYQVDLSTDTPELESSEVRPHWSFHNGGLYPILEIQASGGSYWVHGNVTVSEDSNPFFKYKIGETVLWGDDFDLSVEGVRMIENSGDLNVAPLADCTLEDLEG